MALFDICKTIDTLSPSVVSKTAMWLCSGKTNELYTDEGEKTEDAKTNIVCKSTSRLILEVMKWFVDISISLVAFYLAFKCIKDGKNAFLHLLGACCCSICYIAYAIAYGCGTPL
jgi:hypothetical protein